MRCFWVCAMVFLALSCVNDNPSSETGADVPAASVSRVIERDNIEYLLTETHDQSALVYSVPDSAGDVVRELAAGSSIIISGRSSHLVDLGNGPEFWYWTKPYSRGQSFPGGIGWIHGSQVREVPRHDPVDVKILEITDGTDTRRPEVLVELGSRTVSVRVLSEPDQDFITFQLAPISGYRFFFPMGFYIYDKSRGDLNRSSYIPFAEIGRPYLSDDRRYLFMDGTTGPVIGNLRIYELSTEELIWKGGFNLARLDLGSTKIEEVILYNERRRDEYDSETLSHFDDYLKANTYGPGTDLYVFYETDFASGQRSYVRTVSSPAQ